MAGPNLASTPPSRALSAHPDSACVHGRGEEDSYSESKPDIFSVKLVPFVFTMLPSCEAFPCTIPDQCLLHFVSVQDALFFLKDFFSSLAVEVELLMPPDPVQEGE